MDYGTVTYARRGGAVLRYRLEQEVVRVGSAPDNDLVLPADGVSDYHATITCSTDGCWITDLGTDNGTFLNALRIPAGERRKLREADMLRIGPFFIRYAEPAVPPAEQTPGAAFRERRTTAPPDVMAQIPTAVGERPATRRLPGNAGALQRSAREAQLSRVASSYVQYLPPAYHGVEFLGRFLLIFESILDPLERTIDQMHHYLDPRLTPETMLPWLATWVDLVLNENWPADRRRALIRSASMLYQWRGTRRGLIEYVKLYTGVEPTIIEPNDEVPDGNPPPPNSFRVIIELPTASTLDETLITAIIEAAKPAHTAYRLEVRRTVSA